MNSNNNKKNAGQDSCRGCKQARPDGSCGMKPDGPDALESAIESNLARIRHKMLVLSGKGGVGKSSVAVNLATGLALAGNRVGLLDVDFHGPSIPGMLNLRGALQAASGSMLRPMLFELGPGREPLRVVSIEFFLRNRDDAVIWRGPMKISAIKQLLGQVCWGELDYLVVDSPPGTGDEPLSVAQIIKGARAVVVTTPQKVSLADVRKSIRFCKAVNMEIAGVIENMSGLCCPHCNKLIELFKSGGGQKMAEEMQVPFLGTLPIDPAIVEACDDGRPFVAAVESGPTALAFRSIIEKLRVPA